MTLRNEHRHGVIPSIAQRTGTLTVAPPFNVAIDEMDWRVGKSGIRKRSS